MKSFRDLKVWQKSHALVLSLYKTTQRFPKEELFGLTSQIRRAGVSVPANLAEGCGRGSDAELARFSQISMGSASELEYHILLAKDLEYLDESEYNQLTNETVEIKKMLTAFIQKLKADR